MMKSIILRFKYSIERLISNILISLVTNFFKGKSKQSLEKLIKNNLINLLSIEKDGMFFVTQNYNKEIYNLRELADKYGTDKGSSLSCSPYYTWPAHNYTDYYVDLFQNIRNNPINLLEVGLGTNNTSIRSNMTEAGKPGASLYFFREFFPNSKIYGLDIDKDILFEDHRIKCFYVDQLDSNSINHVFENELKLFFDIIIDDGLHTYNANINFFHNAINYLKNGGIYLIEDVKINNLTYYTKYFKSQKFNFEVINLFRYDNDIDDNNMVIIKK